MRRADHVLAAAWTEPSRPARRRWSALRWLVVVALAGFWSVRPTPIPTDVLYGGGKESPVSAAVVGADSVGASAESVDADTTVRTIDWRVLAQLDFRSTVVPPRIAELKGKRVRIPGFIVPLEDFQEQAKEFLLVPYFGACVHTPPPPPNQMVFVTLSGGPKALGLFDPVWIEGILEVKRVSSPYGAVSYRLRGQRIVPYRE